MVVSWISVDRENADVALGMTNGARLMLSTPPASTRSASPERTARDAIAIASRLDPHNRFTVDPGGHRQVGQQRGHPGDVAVVLAGLVGAAQDHVVQGVPVDRGQSVGQAAQDVGGQVVGPYGGQRAPVPAERGADPVDQVCGGHLATLPERLACSAAPIRLALRRC